MTRTFRMTHVAPPKEYEECIALNDFRRNMLGLEPRLQWLFHVPVGEERPSKLVRNRHTGQMVRISPIAQKLKAMGVLPGVVDYFLPVPTLIHGQSGTSTFHGLWLEMKRRGLTPTQAWAACTEEEQAFLVTMQRSGYATAVASGWVEAAQAVCAYLGRPELLQLSA